MDERVVAVVSSTPHSLPHAHRAFRSILSQTRPPDQIRWHLPLFSVRFRVEYPAVPPWFEEFRGAIQIVRCEDFGPATKTIPLAGTCALSAHDRVLVFDDDTVYPPGAVESLLLQASGRRVGVGVLGQSFRWVPWQYACRGAFSTPPGLHEVNRVDVMLGSEMVLYPAELFARQRDTLLRYQRQHPLLFLNDDHLYAALAHEMSIPLYLVPSPARLGRHDNRGKLTGTNHPMRLQLWMMATGRLPPPVAEVGSIVALALVLWWLKQSTKK